MVETAYTTSESEIDRTPVQGDEVGKIDLEKIGSVGQISHVEGQAVPVVDPLSQKDPPAGLFGGEHGDNYRTMGRWGTLFAMVTNQMGLGVLSLPSALMTLGLVPGIIAIIGLGWITWYTGYELYQFFCKHQHVANVVDMVSIIGGPRWEAVAGFFLLVQLILVAAASSITLSIAFNTLSGHAMCTVGFIGIACIVGFVLCIPRSLGFVAKSGVFCFCSIVIAGLVVLISTGVSGPAQAPAGWSPEIKIFGTPTVRDTFNACLRILYAFAGNIAYVSYMAEMKDPVRDFPFALRGLLISAFAIYFTFAIGVYCVAGEFTASPALGSAPRIPAKVAYGIILPAVVTTSLATGHVGVKYMYVQVLRWTKATDQVTANSVKSWSVWVICVTIFWVVCFVISNAIPVFDSVLSISSSTTFAWFVYGLPAMFWFRINRGSYFDNWKKTTLFGANVALVGFAMLLNGGGVWASVTELLSIFDDPNSAIRGAFDCGDNSLF